MGKYIGIMIQLICNAAVIFNTLTVNNPVWDTLGLLNQNPADKKYTAKGYFRREMS